MEEINTTYASNLFLQFKSCIAKNDITNFINCMQIINANLSVKEFIKTKIKAGEDVDKDGVTLLYVAVQNQNFYMVHELLKLEVNPNCLSRMLLGDKVNPYKIFSSIGIHKEKTTKIERYEEPPIVLAAILRNEDLIRILLKYNAEHIIYDLTPRDKDIFLNEAQKLIVKVKEDLLIETINGSIVQLEERLNDIADTLRKF